MKKYLTSLVIDNFDWIRLSNITRNKFIRIMSYWLFITPVLANAFNKVNSLDLNFLGFSDLINFSLPFSWSLFFFSAFLFGIGNIIYYLKCPELIKDYLNFIDYFNKQKSTYYLIESFRRDMENFDRIKEHRDYDILIRNFANVNNIDKNNFNEEDLFRILKGINNEHMPNLYSSIKLILKDEHKHWRLFATYSYILGFVLIAIVIGQNLAYVLENTFVK